MTASFRLMPGSRASLLGACLLCTGSFLLTGCGHDFGPPGPERTDTRVVELDQSEEVRVELRMGAGEMLVHGGASKLMEGRFTYRRLRMRPEVSYNAGGSRGHLVVEQPSHVGSSSSKYDWDLQLNDQKPLDLEVNFGAGECRLDLSDLSLRRVSVQMGVGELKMDLRGTPKQDYSVYIRGGVGEATIHLPKDVGIEADVQGGIGDIHAPGLEKHSGRYVNAAYGRAKTTVHLDIRGGIGEIHLLGN